MNEGIVGRYGVPGRNETCELEMCAERELVVGNILSRNKYVDYVNTGG